jgi:hypothetical protein
MTLTEAAKTSRVRCERDEDLADWTERVREGVFRWLPRTSAVADDGAVAMTFTKVARNTP